MKFTYLPEVNDVQLKILAKLTTSKNGLKYSQMRPKDETLENDRYNYHLQYLVKNQLITKKKDIYVISNKGKNLIANIDAKGNIKQLFKVSVAIQVVRWVNGNNEILRQRRLRHPFYNDRTGISGKVLYGERVEEAAKRKLIEETGLEASFKLLGVQRKIRKDDQNNILEDTFYHICYAENPTGQLIKKNAYGENYWAPFKQAITDVKNNADLGQYDIEIVERIRDKNFEFFYFQQESVVESY